MDVVNPATTLDFQSPGTLVTDAGAGVAKIWATLIPVIDVGPPEIEGGNVDLIAGKTNRITADAGATGVMPSAASVPNGVPLIAKLVNATNDNGVASGPVDFSAQGGDTIDLYAVGFPSTLTLVGQALMFVSDGVSNWTLVGEISPTAVVPTEQAFLEPVSSATNPDGFSVAYPTDFVVGAALIFSLELQPPTVDDVVDIFVLSYDESQVTLGALSNFADGTFIHITARLKTGGP